MKTFSAGQFAQHLMELSLKSFAIIEAGLTEAAKLVKKAAKDEIGHLQPAVGEYPAWPELKESTKRDKERKGYVFNDEYNPLLREGDLRDSYDYQVKGFEALIGSPSDIALFHEEGTAKMAARPVLGPAAFTSKAKIKVILGEYVVSTITNTKPNIKKIED